MNALIRDTGPASPLAETAGSEESPILRLGNRTVSAVVCLPDTAYGYYPRHPGSTGAASCATSAAGDTATSHPGRAATTPLRHDGLTGPVDEFSPIGYEQARPGEEFLKIGVGTLRRYSKNPYDRFRLHEIVNPGVRETVAARDRIEFRHRLLSDDYGYDYRKRVLLTPDPGLRIEYTLKNLGPAILSGYVYNHTSSRSTGWPRGPKRRSAFRSTPRVPGARATTAWPLRRTASASTGELRRGEVVFMGDLHGPEPATRKYEFSIRNLRTGAGIRVSGSGSLSHMVFWACPNVACIEPYTSFQVFPGETGVWQIGLRVAGIDTILKKDAPGAALPRGDLFSGNGIQQTFATAASTEEAAEAAAGKSSPASSP